jgi:hypothetical protein
MNGSSVSARRIFVALLIVGALTPASVDAGTYTVAGGCGNWGAVNGAPTRLAVYASCPGLVVRNVGGSFTAPQGAQAYWRFVAPPGTTLGRMVQSGDLTGQNGWQR